MTQKEFAEKYLKKTQGFWALVLSGKRRLDYEDAEVVSGLLGTGVGLWAKKKTKPVDVKKASDSRKKAWVKFQRRVR